MAILPSGLEKDAEIFAGLEWLSLEDADMERVAVLAATCLATDGGLPLVATEGFLRERFWDGENPVGLGAFDESGQLRGCGLMQFRVKEEEVLVTAFGLVHPDYRGRGIGTALIVWSEKQADAWFADCSQDRPYIFRVSSETLTDNAARFYAKHHLTQTFGEKVMRYDLRTPLPEAPLPEGLVWETWTDERAEAFFEAYQASFRERPHFPGWSFETWREWIAGDEDFCPERSFVVRHNALPVGFIACSDNYIAQVGVHPEWRRQGIASALLRETLLRLHAAGQTEALLTVADDNTKATAAYLKFGFTIIGRRGRFEKRAGFPTP